jgi:hypothetical protein
MGTRDFSAHENPKATRFRALDNGRGLLRNGHVGKIEFPMQRHILMHMIST